MARSPLSKPRSLYHLLSPHCRQCHREPHLASSPNPTSALSADLLSLPETTPDHAPPQPPQSLILHTSSSFRASNSISRVSALSIADHTRSTIISLAKEILCLANDASSHLASLLESDPVRSIVRLSIDGFLLLQLLSLFKPRPRLALQIIYWRRNLPDSLPLTTEEYASAIALAGRAHNLSLAVKLFYESISTASDRILYNALMTAFMYNSELSHTISLFDKLKNETKFGPDSVSYNILLSLYSFNTLVNQMESVLRAMDSSGIPRTAQTYNILMCGYLRSKRWDEMERIFGSLKEPDVRICLLMLRGYAIAGRLEKMEKLYKLVKEHAQQRSLIWAMICAYSKVRGESSLRKIEELVRLIRAKEYFPHEHVVLIKFYAKEGSIDEMERLIVDAYKRNIVIRSVDVMRTIAAVYYKGGDVNRLDHFIKQAEKAGWSLCKDLYRCKMVLYSRLGRLREMCCVVDKMDSYWPMRDRYTLKVLYKGFSNAGRRLEMDMVIGLMFKCGFQFPREAVMQ
ncbi:pentatricopeptide repeat-containing protein [Carex littledalei]|uniref:Pentatricopeptide repeat-containing protein n=1 Tax=Carex littledalei TaxID=544730 RepID=A0A833VKQ0_9POAL|nr:pentatricopeptide repeat-containing protein [Carex littledalei]